MAWAVTSVLNQPARTPDADAKALVEFRIIQTFRAQAERDPGDSGILYRTLRDIWPDHFIEMLKALSSTEVRTGGDKKAAVSMQ